LSTPTDYSKNSQHISKYDQEGDNCPLYRL
jgi:hypothetical protein